MSCPSTVTLALASTLLLVAICQSVDAQYCGSFDALQESFPAEVSRRSQQLELGHPIKVSVAVEYFSNINQFCGGFRVAVRRINVDERCTSQSDNRAFVFFWNNGASNAFATMCDNTADFKEPCLQTAGFSEFNGCDDPHADRRRKRDACRDLQEQAKCARDIVSDRCGDETADVVCTMISSLLKATTNTKDCTLNGTDVAMCSAVKSTNSVLSTLIPSIIVVLAARRQIFIIN